MQIREAIQIGIQTSFVDIGLCAKAARVLCICQPSAGRSHVLALRRGCKRRLILCVVDELQAIGIVIGELWVKVDLRVDVDAGIDKSNSVDVERYSRPIVISTCDEVVLLFEIVCVDGIVVSCELLSVFALADTTTGE